ncbi:MAG: hypothetical protein MUC35_01000 [Candidatus Margulisbacteria bacterium]|nr:hypothetical protein [Candidatus Margulisiibacteriota bacterium]
MAGVLPVHFCRQRQAVIQIDMGHDPAGDCLVVQLSLQIKRVVAADLVIGQRPLEFADSNLFSRDLKGERGMIDHRRFGEKYSHKSP